MALIEDVLKRNTAAGLAMGAGQKLRKGGMVFYRETLSEIREMATDLVARRKPN